MKNVIRHARRAALIEMGEALSDRQLLDEFVERHDEAAFEVLVRRHGPMVLSVCRRVLGNLQDAEDAFQVCFLILLQKVARIRHPDVLGPWLYGVAYRTALKAKTMNTRRRSRERAIEQRVPVLTNGYSEETAALDEEMNRLPDKYRIPVILCDLSGVTRKEAAQQLGIPEGTLSSRLDQARKRLAGRLTRRGLSLAALLGVASTQSTASVPTPLIMSTVQTGALLVAGGTLEGVLSSQALGLLKGVVKAMYVAKLRNLVTVVAVLCFVGGTGVLCQSKEEPTEPQFIGKVASKPAQPLPTVNELLAQSLRAARDINDPLWKAMAMADIATVQVRTDTKAAARKTFEEAVDGVGALRTQVKDTVLGLLVVKLAAAELAQEAARTAQANTAGPARMGALQAIVTTQAKSGHFEDALTVAESITQADAGDVAEARDHVKNLALREIATAQARAGDIIAARKTMGSITNNDERLIVLGAIVTAQVKAGAKAEARRTLLGVKLEVEAPTRFKAHQSRALARGAVAAMEALLGDIQKAYVLVEGIEDKYFRGVALQVVAMAQAETGDMMGALETARRIPDEVQEGHAVYGLIERLLASGKVAEAAAAAEAIRHPGSQVQAWAVLAKAYAHRDDRQAMSQLFERAFAKATGLPQVQGGVFNIRDAALTNLAQALAEVGQARKALTWALEQKEPVLRSQALRKIAEGMAAREAMKKPAAK